MFVIKKSLGNMYRASMALDSLWVKELNKAKIYTKEGAPQALTMIRRLGYEAEALPYNEEVAAQKELEW